MKGSKLATHIVKIHQQTSDGVLQFLTVSWTPADGQSRVS